MTEEQMADIIDKLTPETNKATCEACRIELSHEQVKNMPEHTCIKKRTADYSKFTE